jgi:methyltransferase (TIGR00027 family)
MSQVVPHERALVTTLNPVSRTAYYCCGVRALDAAAARPLCGDRFAERFMTPEAWAIFDPFRDLREPNASNVVRHRMIDDLLVGELAHRPDAPILLIGAGFDSRAFRLPGGRWIELDEPGLIANKESRLPAREAPNPLTRIPVSFGREQLGEVLAPFRGLSPIVVVEGVLPYLEGADVERLLQAVRGTFSAPTLVCDLTTRGFQRRYGGKIGDRLRQLGAPYGRLEQEPLGLIEAAGFGLRTRESIVGRAAALGALAIPQWLLATVFRGLRDGYVVATFDAGP